MLRRARRTAAEAPRRPPERYASEAEDHTDDTQDGHQHRPARALRQRAAERLQRQDREADDGGEQPGLARVMPAPSGRRARSRPPPRKSHCSRPTRGRCRAAAPIHGGGGRSGQRRRIPAARDGLSAARGRRRGQQTGRRPRARPASPGPNSGATSRARPMPNGQAISISPMARGRRSHR